MATSAIEIGRRLVALHDGLGISQAEVCRAIGINPNRYSQYVNGKRQLTLDVAARLVSEYGITLDWLFLGDRAKLPQELREKIRRAA
jgi:transcriptional regulator with XRE-family HTH domain